MGVIDFESVTFSYGDGNVIVDLDLHVDDGEVLAIVGPSGSGKSTLLRLVAGIIKPSRGNVLLDGVPVAEQRRGDLNVAMVFEDNVLYPFLTTRRNVEFPLRVRHVPRDEIDQRVEAESRVLAIEHLLEKMPNQLSAGHQQLVQAAKALVRAPDAFLMDEPLARMDPKLRRDVRNELRLLQRGYGVTMLYVTHDQADGMAMGDRLLVLDEGRTRQLGPPLEVYGQPADAFVAKFVGSPPMPMLRGRVRRDGDGYVVDVAGSTLRAWAPALAGVVGHDVMVGVRPEAVTIGDGPVRGEVGTLSYLGSHALVAIDTPDGTLFARVDVPPGHGEIRATIERFHVFDPRTGRALAHAGI